MRKNFFIAIFIVIILGGTLIYMIFYLQNRKGTALNPGINNERSKTNRNAQELEAIKKAKEELGIFDFPDQVGKVEGSIHGGGPAPGIEVPGSFETAVQKNDDGSYIVTFTESWQAKDFHYAGEDKENLSHYFKYKVTAYGAEAIESGGDFPPQAVK